MISSVIFEGERSFNHTSTASRLMLARPLFFLHHHLPPPHPISPLSHTRPPGQAPLPSVEVCGPDRQRPQQVPEVGSQSHPPLPSPEGCGRLIVAQQRSWGGKNTRGDPSNGRPDWYVTKTNHDFGRGSFSSYFAFFPAADHTYAPL